MTVAADRRAGQVPPYLIAPSPPPLPPFLPMKAAPLKYPRFIAGRHVCVRARVYSPHVRRTPSRPSRRLLARLRSLFAFSRSRDARRKMSIFEIVFGFRAPSARVDLQSRSANSYPAERRREMDRFSGEERASRTRGYTIPMMENSRNVEFVYGVSPKCGNQISPRCPLFN